MFKPLNNDSLSILYDIQLGVNLITCIKIALLWQPKLQVQRHYRQNLGRQEVQSMRRWMNEAERQTSFIHSTSPGHLTALAKL